MLTAYDGTPYSDIKPRWKTLIDLINARGYKSMVEIGVIGRRDGITARNILEKCSLEAYFLVDPKVTNSLHSFICGKPAVYMLMPSSKACLYVADKSIDLVFIDADHGYKGVKSDIVFWLPKIRDEGVICGHDYSPNSKGVAAAVQRFFSTFELIGDNEVEVWAESAVWIAEVPGSIKEPFWSIRE